MARTAASSRTAPLVTWPMQPSAFRIAACMSPTNAPRPGGLSLSSNTRMRGDGICRMLFQKSARSWNVLPTMGGSPLRSRAVAAYPTMGGASLKMQRMLAFVNPVLCNRILKVSIAFAIMQVSNCRKASNSPSVKKGASAMYASFQERGMPTDYELAAKANLVADLGRIDQDFIAIYSQSRTKRSSTKTCPGMYQL